MEEKRVRSGRVFWIFVGVVVFLLAFSGPALAYSEKEPLVLKASIDNPPGDMKAKTIKYFGDIVENNLKGGNVHDTLQENFGKFALLKARICQDILGGQEFPHSVQVNVWTDAKDFHANASGAPVGSLIAEPRPTGP